MVNTCFICKKRSDKSPGLSYHKLPSNPADRQQWLNICGRSKEVPGKGAAVCANHFDVGCFRYGLVHGKKLLKQGSKPTLNLGKLDPNRAPTKIPIETEISSVNNISDNTDMLMQLTVPLEKQQINKDISSIPSDKIVDSKSTSNLEKLDLHRAPTNIPIEPEISSVNIFDNTDMLMQLTVPHEKQQIDKDISSLPSDKIVDCKPTSNLGKLDLDSAPMNIPITTEIYFVSNISDNTDMLMQLTVPFEKQQIDEDIPLLPSEEIVDSEPTLHPIINTATISNKREQGTSQHVVAAKKRRLTDITWEDFTRSPNQGKILWETAKQQILNQQRKIESVQRTVRRFRKKISSLKSLTQHMGKKKLLMKNESKLLHSTMDPAAEALFKQMLSTKKRVSEYPLSLRTFAATLLFLSPKAYTYMRQVFSHSLPHPATVRKWFTLIDASPEISKPELETL